LLVWLVVNALILAWRALAVSPEIETCDRLSEMLGSITSLDESSSPLQPEI
jgi:hypothetical protein